MAENIINDSTDGNRKLVFAPCPQCGKERYVRPARKKALCLQCWRSRPKVSQNVATTNESGLALIGREEARARGLTRYFTGLPCTHGHIAERRTSDTACWECLTVLAACPRCGSERRVLRKDAGDLCRACADADRRKRGAESQFFKHGLREHPLYNIWKGMHQRCYNPSHPDYNNYGARGITVCDRWLESFPNFVDDMGERPPRSSLDRVDVDGPYSVENCKWATALEQARNTRSSTQPYILRNSVTGELYETHPPHCKCPAHKLSSDDVKAPERKRGVRLNHGLYKHPLYSTWTNMIKRCYSPRCPEFKYYGARGIAVCERWRHSFPNFLEDMGDRPRGMSLERINNDADYERANCKWASRAEQQANRRKRPIKVYQKTQPWKQRDRWSGKVIEVHPQQCECAQCRLHDQ